MTLDASQTIALFVVALVIGGGVYLIRRSDADERRGAVLKAIAHGRDYRFARIDVDGLVRYAFGFFDRSDEQRAENVVSSCQGPATHVFDYSYWPTGRRGHRRRYTCGFLELDSDCPWMRIARHHGVGSLGTALGQHHIEVESVPFNRAYRVLTADQRFAFSVLDAHMIEWLLAQTNFDAIEINGEYALVVGYRLRPRDWMAFAQWLDTFRAKIPTVVASFYPVGRHDHPAFRPDGGGVR